MISSATSRFWREFNKLSESLQKQARAKYELWLADASHPSLHFKPLRDAGRLWSVRINRDCRALGYYETPSHFVWLWIGHHDEYDKLIK